ARALSKRLDSLLYARRCVPVQVSTFLFLYHKVLLRPNRHWRLSRSLSHHMSCFLLNRLAWSSFYIYATVIMTGCYFVIKIFLHYFLRSIESSYGFRFYKCKEIHFCPDIRRRKC